MHIQTGNQYIVAPPSVHTKRGTDENDPKTMLIDYQVELNEFKTEWVCPEHSGWVRKKFEKWWAERSDDLVPETTEDAVRLADAGSLSMPSHIVVRKIGGERFERIIRYTLPPEKPPAVGNSEYVPVYVEDVPF